MKFLTNFKLLLKQIFSFVVYGVSFLFPRNKKIWIYGNLNSSFRDNCKYFFIYNCTHFPEIRHVWISRSDEVIKYIRSLGFQAFPKVSLPAFYYALRASVYIYDGAPTDTVHGCLRGNAFCFNLWHGTPFKKIEYNIEKASFYKSFFNPVGLGEKISSFLFEPKAFRNSDGVLTTSAKMVDIFSSAFKIAKSKVFIGPYPRNEVFHYSATELQTFIDKYESPAFTELCQSFAAYKSVVIYMPTFRDGDEDFMDKAIPDFLRLNAVCKAQNILFLIKAHPVTRFSADLSTFSHIKNLDKNLDVYPLLPYTAALISDYSSIIFDYTLLYKKIIFYAFDKSDYLVRSRESYFEYEAVFSRHVTTSFDDLLHELELLEPGTQHDYPLCRALMDNGATIGDITNHIKTSIHYN